MELELLSNQSLSDTVFRCTLQQYGMMLTSTRSGITGLETRVKRLWAKHIADFLDKCGGVYEHVSDRACKRDPSALWCLQIVYQKKRLQDPSGKRVIPIENFYTSHIRANKLFDMKHGEMRIIGTVNYINLHGKNRTIFKGAVEAMKERPRGNWLLTQAFDPS